jgi:metal-responsive CopG/Arc/MetJ family transcriptional regulator
MSKNEQKSTLVGNIPKSLYEEFEKERLKLIRNRSNMIEMVIRYYFQNKKEEEK